ncbi:chromosome segregation protein [compost metagenome]
MEGNRRMKIKKVKIQNFKSFYGEFVLELSDGMNILVGNNEAGKSTILEAIHIALTGLLNGRQAKNELTQYFFNNTVVSEYLTKLEQKQSPELPYILIEIYLSGEDIALLEGNGNSDRAKESGISLKICFDEKYQGEYEQLVSKGDVKTLPIEYYDFVWSTFAREIITPKSIPLKSALIDSSSNRYQNGSDIYISRIVRENLEPEDIVDISQAHRKMRDNFMSSESIKVINARIQETAVLTGKKVELSVELLSKNAWENSLVTYLDDVPFHFVGKGEQCIVKTELALSHKKTRAAAVILMEEPENHLSHTKLNQFINKIAENQQDKQIIVSTHSSFVANKLGLSNLILLNDKKAAKLSDLKDDTGIFFQKVAGYDTLRLILCKKAILVEGDSDELVIQKAYMLSNVGKLPIHDEIDVISVGTSFLRFLEIAVLLNKPVTIVTDNDGDIDAITRKYSDYLGDNAKDFIKICYDQTIDEGDLVIGKNPFNYNTLEPKLLKVNELSKLNTIFGTKYTQIDDMHKYMKSNKTECALKIFETDDTVIFPEYILEAIR